MLGRTLGLFDAFPTLLGAHWGGTIDPRALRFLVVREIDCGDWLARRCMPAHQHCDLFYPLSWGCDWVYHKLGNAPILQSGAGSWVLSGSSGVRHPLSPVIGWVFETQTNKQTQKISSMYTSIRSTFVRQLREGRQ